eukprot:TRINITY_DN8758_c0_g1_i1.p1 TRINITY_DN8758_c0_g1~~TRINITY_DN8758_c0_g1_i1.p1  ORF type:complete len:444 (+),score=115.95 TRINITY_DN8758_c0_g1_i1:119-1450(+)
MMHTTTAAEYEMMRAQTGRHLAAATEEEVMQQQQQQQRALPRLLGGKPVYQMAPVMGDTSTPAEPMKVHPLSAMQANPFMCPLSSTSRGVDQAQGARFAAQQAADAVPIRLSSLLPDAGVAMSPPGLSTGAGNGLQMITLICDAQHGQAFLAWLRKAEAHEVNAIFELLLPSTIALSMHENGRLVIEEILALGNRCQRLQIADKLRGHVVSLAMDASGCWVVQKALQLLPVDVQIELAAELAPKVSDCIESKHGNFVVQVCVEQMPPDSVDFIVRAVERRAQHFASHRFGCRVIQRLLEHCPVMQVVHILEQLVEASLELSISPYACHVVHCVLEHGRVDDKQKIFDVVRANIVRLSRGRLSCSVVEKCMEIATVGQDGVFLQGHLQALFHAVLQDDVVEDMARKRFGRALLKRMLDYAPGPDRDMLQQKLTEARPSMMITSL